MHGLLVRLFGILAIGIENPVMIVDRATPRRPRANEMQMAGGPGRVQPSTKISAAGTPIR